MKWGDPPNRASWTPFGSCHLRREGDLPQIWALGDPLPLSHVAHGGLTGAMGAMRGEAMGPYGSTILMG